MSGLKPSNTNEQEVEQHLSSEQAADLAALQAAAGAGEDPAAAVEGEAAVSVPMVPLHQEIAGMVLMFVGIVAPAFPSLTKIYDEQTAGAVGNAVAGECSKYGWCQNGVGGEYGPEIAAAIVLVPLGIATKNAIAADIAAREPEPKKLQEQGAGILGSANIAAAVVDAGPISSKTAGFGPAVPDANG